MLREIISKPRLNLGIRSRILRHPLVDEAVKTIFTRKRLKLPQVDLLEAAGGKVARVVTRLLPLNPWDTPFNDLVPLCALAMSVAPRRILEVGTCRGQGTLQLTANCPQAKITTYDIDEKAGAYFRQDPVSESIELRISDFNSDRARLLAEPPYDFIFIDALHTFDAVLAQSELALELVSKGGIIAWHDYANGGSEWLLSENGVPEALWKLSEKVPVYSIRGTSLAFCRASSKAG